MALNDSYALIGARGVSTNLGDAYLYNLGTGAWIDLAATSGQPVIGLGSSSSFGYSVALNDSYALIGANGVSSNRGDAYLYNLGTGAWTDLAATSGQPVTGLTGSANFGSSVALNSSYALIGAQGVSNSRSDAYLYNLGTGVWTDLATAGISPPVTGLGNGALFGTSVALNDNYALIGASSLSSYRGDAYLYNLSTGVWTDLATAGTSPVTGLGSNSNFGNSVALNSSYALIGASGAGDAYLYNLGTTIWTNLATAGTPPVTGGTTEFGSSVALNSSYALIGAQRGVELSWRCVPVQPGHVRLDRSGYGRHLAAGDWAGE